MTATTSGGDMRQSWTPHDSQRLIELAAGEEDDHA